MNASSAPSTDTARRLVHGTISNPPPSPSSSSKGDLEDVRIPRLDAVIFNAGFGGWTGLDWVALARMFFSELSTKDNAVYNHFVDMFSLLSAGQMEEESFRRIVKFLLGFVEKVCLVYFPMSWFLFVFPW